MKKINDLRVTLVQPDIAWKNADTNRNKIRELLSAGAEMTDLVLLPEMFTTGFCTEPDSIAETMDGDTIRWMKRTAESLKCSVAGSLVIRDSKRHFNRLIYIDRYANMTWYDKRHLFRMAEEEVKFTAGRKRLIVPLNGWQINFQICYDLRFPVWAKNQNDYDVLVNVANWPEARRDVWHTLLRARALENQCYAIGVNRVGTDGNGISHKGESMVIDPKGNSLDGIMSTEEEIHTFTLSWEDLTRFREKFPVWKDWDSFSLNV